jgi:WD40 repeat protein
MADPLKLDRLPLGFRLRHVLRGHGAVIACTAWSPDGQMLAAGSDDTIALWDARRGCTSEL